MRYCHGEDVKVFAAESTDLAVALREVADEVEKSAGGYVSIHVDFQTENCEYLVTMYLHE